MGGIQGGEEDAAGGLGVAQGGVEGGGGDVLEAAGALEGDGLDGVAEGQVVVEDAGAVPVF